MKFDKHIGGIHLHRDDAIGQLETQISCLWDFDQLNLLNTSLVHRRNVRHSRQDIRLKKHILTLYICIFMSYICEELRYNSGEK